MIEPSDRKKFFDRLILISKTVLELLRNILVVTTLGYLYKKSNSVFIRGAYWLSLLALVTYISSLVQIYQLKRSFFANTTEGEVFGIILNGIVFLLIGTITIFFITQVINDVIAIQIGP